MQPVLALAADVSALSDSCLYDKVYASVSDARRKKTDRLRFAKDKYLSLGAEYLLMHACRETGIDYFSEPAAADKNGKPYFISGCAHFSLSHANERAFCVLSGTPVGCDVEKTGSAPAGIASRFFSEAECRSLAACETETARDELFFTLWTLKESFMKCTGLGFRLPLNAFSITEEAGRILVRQTVEPAVFTFFTDTDADGYRYALCLKNASPVPAAESVPVRFVTIE